MFGSDMPVRESLRFLGGIGQHALALIAQGQVHRGRDFFPNRGVTLNLLADGLNRGVRAQESIGQGFVFAQEPQQQVLGLYIRRPELACFVARKKDDAPGFLRITFKHNALPPEPFWSRRHWLRLDLPKPRPTSLMTCILIRVTSSLCNQTATKPKYSNVTAMLPKEPVEISTNRRSLQFLALCLTYLSLALANPTCS